MQDKILNIAYVGDKVQIHTKSGNIYDGFITCSIDAKHFLFNDGTGHIEVDIDDIHEMILLSRKGTPIVNDVVNHPQHYQSETGLETIDVIEAFTFDLKGIEAVCTGNVLKYICRWPQKNGLEDLKKARWYLDRLINHVEKLEEENK